MYDSEYLPPVDAIHPDLYRQAAHEAELRDELGQWDF